MGLSITIAAMLASVLWKRAASQAAPWPLPTVCGLSISSCAVFLEARPTHSSLMGKSWAAFLGLCCCLFVALFWLFWPRGDASASFSTLYTHFFEILPYHPPTACTVVRNRLRDKERERSFLKDTSGFWEQYYFMCSQTLCSTFRFMGWPLLLQ